MVPADAEPGLEQRGPAQRRVGRLQLPDRRGLGHGDVVDGPGRPQHRAGQHQAPDVDPFEQAQEHRLLGGEAGDAGGPDHQGRQQGGEAQRPQRAQQGHGGLGGEPVGQVEGQIGDGRRPHHRHPHRLPTVQDGRQHEEQQHHHARPQAGQGRQAAHPPQGHHGQGEPDGQPGQHRTALAVLELVAELGLDVGQVAEHHLLPHRELGGGLRFQEGLDEGVALVGTGQEDEAHRGAGEVGGELAGSDLHRLHPGGVQVPGNADLVELLPELLRPRAGGAQHHQPDDREQAEDDDEERERIEPSLGNDQLVVAARVGQPGLDVTLVRAFWRGLLRHVGPAPRLPTGCLQSGEMPPPGRPGPVGVGARGRTNGGSKTRRR